MEPKNMEECDNYARIATNVFVQFSRRFYPRILFIWTNCSLQYTGIIFTYSINRFISL